VLNRIKELGQEDNTLVLAIIGDNGGSAEGGLKGVFNELRFFNGVSEPYSELENHLDELGKPSSYVYCYITSLTA